MHYSKPAALALLFIYLGPKATQVCVQAQDVEFKKLGEGYCLDCGDRYYDNIYFHNLQGTPTSLIASAEDCEPLCKACNAEVASRELRGFEYYSDGGCSCLFDHHDTIEFTFATCASIGAFSHYLEVYGGSGDVCSLDKSQALGVECWMATELSSNPSKSPHQFHHLLLRTFQE